ncbi:hypothetical protein CR513_12236, partial [Mucuna pruriens]
MFGKRPNISQQHGNLLRIFEAEIQPASLETLVQFYDPPARCFTFKVFQLAPTLEEDERLLDLPLVESTPYFYQGQQPSWATMTKLLKIPEPKMARERRNRNGLEGINRCYLEGRLLQLREEND